MEAISAVYIRMNILLEELGTKTEQLYREINSLKEKTAKLYVSWQGEAFEEFSRVLKDDMTVMEITAVDAMYFYRLLRDALGEYQRMEMRVSEAVGVLK
jgi:uncharacterized protein YukE